ncbi:MAG: HAMP domain-containing sensor histidine kinase [Nitrososphaeraceae archaeon]
MTASQDNALEKTEVVYGLDNIINKTIEFLSKAGKIDSCGDARAAKAILDVAEFKKILFEVKSRGIKTRYITEINKDNIDKCKQLMELVGSVRHLDGIRANFSTSEIEYLASMTGIQTAKPVPHIIYSNVLDIVEEQNYVFESFWNKATPAEQRIREIEEGIEPEFFEVIAERNKISQIFLDLVGSAKKEALVLFPNDKAMVRAYRLGIIDYLVKISQNEKAVSIKIICQLSEENVGIVKKVSEQAPGIRILNGNESLYGMYIIDGEKLLRVEMKDASAETFMEAIGFAVYSNRKNTVQSFRSVFELLWNERTLNEELKRTHDRQKELIKMQQEFINVAAHELRTPVQPIIGLSEILRSKLKDNEQEELLSVIIRNAKRLRQLTQNLLDVTRIDSQSLRLKKELSNVNDVILSVLADYESDNNLKNVHNDGVKITFNSKDDIFVMVDRSRLYQVFANLLNNAIKFTKEGSITITTQRNDEGNEAVVSIKDTGVGLHPEILPRLFSKFATGAETGTGLGLFISKGVVEAHGGRIWAENNEDNKGGSIFHFSLPLGRE